MKKEAANDEIVPAEALPISDQDLAAYVEGSLSESRRRQIEGFLACNPDLAARVMQALHVRERSASLRSAARRPKVMPLRARVVAACIACGVAGWAIAEGLDDEGLFDNLSSTPEYVEDAIMSLKVAHVRSQMASQLETPTLDSMEIQRATQIRMPVLPEGWRLVDTQIFPSDEGPSVSVLIETAPGLKVNLFAVRADTSVAETPEYTTGSGTPAAYWEREGAAYVLTGDDSRGDLLAQAALLARSGLM